MGERLLLFTRATGASGSAAAPVNESIAKSKSRPLTLVIWGLWDSAGNLVSRVESPTQQRVAEATVNHTVVELSASKH